MSSVFNYITLQAVHTSLHINNHTENIRMYLHKSTSITTEYAKISYVNNFLTIPSKGHI